MHDFRESNQLMLKHYTGNTFLFSLTMKQFVEDTFKARRNKIGHKEMQIIHTIW